MLFQYPLGGERLTGVFQSWNAWGFQDFFMPFLLFFALFFAVLQKIGLFKRSARDKDGKPIPDKLVPDGRLNGILAGGLSFLAIAAHFRGYYSSLPVDPVVAVSQILPSSVIVGVALLLAFVMIGLARAPSTVPNTAQLLLGLIGAGLVVIIAVKAIYPAILPSWINVDPNSQAVAIVVLVMGLIIWYITRTTETTTEIHQLVKGWTYSEPAAAGTAPAAAATGGGGRGQHGG